MNITRLLNIVGSPAGTVTLIKRFQDTGDIINAVIEQHALNAAAARKLAPAFDNNNVFLLCQNLWNFIHYKLNYRAEPNSQTVKTLSKILFDAGAAGNDCKHFAGFTASILDVLNVPFFYRFACYDNSKIPTHVYCVVSGNGREIVMDSVLNYFNTEKKYISKIDIDIKKKR